MSGNPIVNLITKQMVETGSTDDYELITRIGSGRYGEVFEAFNVTNNRRVAIKVLKPVRPEKVLREINVLKCLNGGQNVIPLKDIVINNGIPALIFPFVSNETLKSLVLVLSEFEIHYYLRKLLTAIDFAHKNNIIHRDIKPSNVMIDRSRKVLRLIDWGLADFHTNNKTYSVTVASRHYKSPELLCNYNKYDYSMDIWSFGCIVAGLVFRKEPFFNGLDNLDQLKTICLVLGTHCLREYVQKYNLTQTSVRYLLDTDLKPKNWKEFTASGYESVANEMTIDFIDKLLVFDHKFRLAADEALCHPFFNCVKTSKILSTTAHNHK